MSMDQIKVTYLDHMGDDLTVVNNARVSFAKEAREFTGKDTSLLRFLARGMTQSEWDDYFNRFYHSDVNGSEVEQSMSDLRNTPAHWTPFANGCQVQLHIKAPVAIMRQVFKHKVGTVESEVSRRYVTEQPEIFSPDWRRAADNVKQGSGEERCVPSPMSLGVISEDGARTSVQIDHKVLTQIALGFYHHLLDQGVCPEQARFVLPQGTMTEARITNSLYGWARFWMQRHDVAHAQREAAAIAAQVRQIIEPLFPYSWKALTGQ